MIFPQKQPGLENFNVSRDSFSPLYRHLLGRVFLSLVDTLQVIGPESTRGLVISQLT